MFGIGERGHTSREDGRHDPEHPRRRAGRHRRRGRGAGPARLLAPRHLRDPARARRVSQAAARPAAATAGATGSLLKFT